MYIQYTVILLDHICGTKAEYVNIVRVPGTQRPTDRWEFCSAAECPWMCTLFHISYLILSGYALYHRYYLEL